MARWPIHARPWLVATLLLGLVAHAPIAHAKDVSRIVFLGVGGTGGAPFAELLLQDLSDAYTVLSGETYRKTAQKLGRMSANEDDVRAVCGTIGADALVAGTVRSEPGGRIFQLSIRDGVTGRIVQRIRYPLVGTTLPQIRDKVVFDLVRQLSRLDQPIGQPGGDDEKPLKSTAPPANQPDAGQGGDASEGDDAPLVTPATTKKAPSIDRTFRGLQFGVGPSLTTRSLRFDNLAAPGYFGGTVYGIKAYVAVFPIALSAELANAHPVLSSFGVEAEYERVFRFTSDNGLVATDGNASRWMVRFVGRIPLGRAARGGHLSLQSGYQHLSWHSSSPADLRVPNVDYRLFDAGLAWDKTLGTRYVVLSLRLGGLAMLSGGGITSIEEYGSARGGGLDASAKLELKPKDWLSLRLGAQYTGLFLQFDATGARFARSAKDQFVAGTLEIGFAL